MGEWEQVIVSGCVGVRVGEWEWVKEWEWVSGSGWEWVQAALG